ncbi:MAG: lipopolysaccharide biosynthesis protein [Pseudomonadota bacterium]
MSDQTTSLKSVALSGMVWTAAERFTTQGGKFVISIVLARLLIPEDFGLIGMLSIFIDISQSLIDSGMGSGLVQKKNRTDIDFSTVFVFNFFVSIAIYLILFLCAPLIADFYDMPQLAILTRVLTLNIIINSFAIVQRTRLTINIDFKTIAKVNVVSVFLGGGAGIAFAYAGLGVWALVIMNLFRTIITVTMLWFLSRWAPSFLFSGKSFRDLFGFGSKLLLAGLYAQIFNNIYNIVIGKAYSASDLGFYTKTKQFAEVTAGTITSIMQQVTYPILASLKDDRSRMISVFSWLIRMSAFFIFPAMTLLSSLADPFVRLILTEKWLPMVPLLQWMCFARIFFPLSVINMNILNAIGRSDLFLKLDLSKAPLIILALVITIPLGVKAMVIGHVVTSFLAFFMNAYLPGRLFGYGPLKQFRDILKIILATIGMALAVFVCSKGIESDVLKLFYGIVTGIASYLFLAFFLRIPELDEVKQTAIRIYNRCFY